MRRLVIFIVTIAVALAVFVMFAVERVPGGHEALKITHDGDITLLEPGIHIVMPGAEVIVYPTGKRTYRCPETGTFDVITQEREQVPVAFSLTVDVAPGSAPTLYGRFSEHFDDAARRVVKAAAEIEAATISKTADRDRYLDDVLDNVREQFGDVGVTVASLTLVAWGDESATAAAGPQAQAADVSDTPPRKLVLIGIDGGDWLNIQPLVDAGKLPNFKRLLEKGATGPLESQEPILSPLLWTTMATGKNPEEHGILNFTVADPETGAKSPITRYYRKVDAWWNMLGDYGRTVGVVGWLATDPAEQVNGIMVTDKVGYLAYAPTDQDTGLAKGTVNPWSRAGEIAKRVVHAGDVTYDEMEPFMHITREEFLKHRDMEQDPKDAINGLILLYAATRTYESIAMHLLEHDHPDVLAVYFELVDATSHLFMLESPPRMSDVSEADYARFKDAVAQAYITQDAILGRFMDALDDNSVLMVVSDHGFKSGASRLRNRPEIWAGNAAKWHRLNGIVGFYGNGVEPGARITGASILDVAPTILAIEGLPRAADMPGKRVVQAFTPAVLEQFNPETVPTLERERPDEVAAGDSIGGAADEETMKKLEALGYLTPDNADAHNNLGQRYQDRGEYDKAIAEYRTAISMRPDFYSAYNNIAVCYGKLGQYDEAEAALLKTIELKPDNFYAMNNLAVMNIERRQLDRALQYAKECVDTEPGYVNGRITYGSALAMTGRLDEAEVQFREALKLEPGNKTATTNLEKLQQARAQQGRGGG